MERIGRGPYIRTAASDNDGVAVNLRRTCGSHVTNAYAAFGPNVGPRTLGDNDP